MELRALGEGEKKATDQDARGRRRRAIADVIRTDEGAELFRTIFPLAVEDNGAILCKDVDLMTNPVYLAGKVLASPDRKRAGWVEFSLAHQYVRLVISGTEDKILGFGTAAGGGRTGSPERGPAGSSGVPKGRLDS